MQSFEEEEEPPMAVALGERKKVAKLSGSVSSCSLVRGIRRPADFSTNGSAFQPGNWPWHIQVCACYPDHRLLNCAAR